MKKIIKENKTYLIVMTILLVIFNVRLPYYISAPGGIINISNRIEYEEKQDYKGSLNMLYVTEYKATIPLYLMSFVLKNWDLESIKESQVSNETTKEIDIRNKIMLNNSIDNAKYVAYKAAGKDITISKKIHKVIATTTNTNLKIGDQIIEVNNRKIEDSEEIREIIADSQVDDILNIKVLRNNKEQLIKEAIKEIDNAKVLGVMIVTDYEFETNPDIDLKFRRDESGSSGGLMMALSIYSAIGEEDILKGRNIAGTGTINMNGTVGEIAGVKYKIMGAAKNNIDIVLVPQSNYEEAIQTKKDNNYDLRIVSINTFQEAIDYLKS